MSGPLTRIKAPAAAMLEDGIDTDAIFPARFLLRMEKKGLGECLFADRKRTADGESFHSGSRDRPGRRRPQILFAGAQFGCGSSREHAVWSLIDYGIRVVIAPSFGEIFASNAARNGLALITLGREPIERLSGLSETGDVAIDFVGMIITTSEGTATSFQMSEEDRRALLNGWDQIDMIEAEHIDQIERFESADATKRPWLQRTSPPE